MYEVYYDFIGTSEVAPCLSFFEGKEILTREAAEKYPETLVIMQTISHVPFRDDTVLLYKSRKNNNLKTKVICDYTCEDFPDRPYQDVILSKLTDFDINDVMVIYMSSYDLRGAKIEFPYAHFSLDTMAVHVYEHIFKKNHPIDSTLVKNRVNGLNVLLSKIRSRDTRFMLTYYLYKHNLLDSSILSILATPQDIRLMMNKHPLCSDESYYNKIIKYLGPADNIQLVDGDDSGISVVNNFPIDVNIFKNSSISLIAETQDTIQHNKSNYVYAHPNMLTEKLYKSIVNKHPFVIQGSPGMIDVIKKRGYQTFSSIIDESYNHYDFTTIFQYNEDPLGYAVESTVLAARDFLHKLPNYTDLVQEIVDFNFDSFIRNTTQDIDRANLVIEQFITS